MAGASGVATADLLDLITATRRKLVSRQFIDTFKYTQYEVLGYFLGNRRVERGGGRGISETVRIAESGTAQHVRAYQDRTLVQPNVLATLEVDFVNADDYWMISDIETGQNEGDRAERVVDLSLARRGATLEGIANLVEDGWWATPNAADDRLPWGLKYGIVARAAAGEGFDGGAPSGFTTVYGINPTTYSRWKNWAAGGAGYYVDVDRTFVRTLRTAMRKTNFQAPARISLGLHPKSRFRLYVNSDTINKIEERSEAQNDRLGPDIARYYGGAMVNRMPFRYAQGLDADATNPVYGTNMATWRFRVMATRDLVERKPMRDVHNHDVAVNFIDFSYLWVCENRRRNFIVHE